MEHSQFAGLVHLSGTKNAQEAKGYGQATSLYGKVGYVHIRALRIRLKYEF